jgi:hypothetical protein
MKRTLLLVLLYACVSLVVQATPCVSGGTLDSYIGLGAAGCTFDGLLFNNFAYTNTASGGGVSPDATGVKVDTIPGTEAGLEFVGSWLAGTNQTSDGNIAYSVTCQNCQIDDLALIMNGVGEGTGIASVAETSTSPSIALGTTSFVGFTQLTDSTNIKPIGTLNLTKDIGASGGTGGNGGSGHVSGVYNLFSTNTQTTMSPEPSLLLLCVGALSLLPVARKMRRA